MRVFYFTYLILTRIIHDPTGLRFICLYGRICRNWKQLYGNFILSVT